MWILTSFLKIGKIIIDQPYPFGLIKVLEPNLEDFKDEILLANNKECKISNEFNCSYDVYFDETFISKINKNRLSNFLNYIENNFPWITFVNIWYCLF